MTNIKENTKQTLSLKPKLRFNEFEGEWEKKNLRDLTKINQGLQIAISERFTEAAEGLHFYITNEFLRAGSTKKYFIKNPSESVLCTEDDILMTRTGNTGQVVTGVKGAFHNNFFKIKFDSNCDKWFLYYFLTDYKTQHTILKLAGISTIPDLNHGDFYRLKINLPNLPEQQKIANFLTAVDTKLQQLTTKKELLAQYKKGVMQQLFSQELRFKPDVDKESSLRASHCEEERRGKLKQSLQNKTEFPDWEEKRLGEVGEIIGGGTPDTTNNDYWDGDIQWFTPTEVSNKMIDKSKRTITSLGLKKSSARILPKGTILFTSRATIAELSFAKEECTTNQGFQSIVVNVKNNSEFVYYWINNNKKEFIRKSQGSTFLEISKNEMKKIKMFIPSLKEQQKIATYLSAIDIKIEAVQTQISNTQAFKKGLLQQLFV